MFFHLFHLAIGTLAQTGRIGFKPFFVSSQDSLTAHHTYTINSTIEGPALPSSLLKFTLKFTDFFFFETPN